MVDISQTASLGQLQNALLRERAENAHGGRSIEFVASVDGEEAGLLSYEDWSDSGSGFIYEIFVIPSSRKMGVGACLLAYAEQYARGLGCCVLRLKPHALESEPDSTQLVDWYMKVGYVQVADDPSHYEKSLSVPCVAQPVAAADGFAAR
ncbi:GNAT family N-acetyltransferase [Methylobacillus sp. Pita2]|uniref:GNAT family N-acetyltransferase n=1 Tax=Methylobacillus sp. Pita2 TaxID=3383245 RepID=UPI0038B4B2E6